MGAAHPASPDITDGESIVLLPLGAWEQHGPHLPLDTDTLIIEAVVADACQALEPFTVPLLIAPTISISASDEHGGFPGTLSTGTQALVDSVVAICRSATWAREICIVNGHGGNSDALRRIASALDHENIRYSIWSLPSYNGADMHAGRTETSVMLYLHPHHVNTQLLETGATGEASDLIAAMRTGGVASVAPNGIIGDATTATSDHGHDVMNMYSTSLQTHLSSRLAD